MIKLEHIDNGKEFDFSRISEDYAKYRDNYPDVFYQKILELGLCKKGSLILDLGTGTGVLPRHLAQYGAEFIGVDISENQIKWARKLSKGMNIKYIVSPVEKIAFPENTFDTILSCMCFTYFNKKILLPKIAKILKDSGRFAILSLIWLPHESEIAKGSEEIILKYNPSWNGAGYTRPVFDENGLPKAYGVDPKIGLELDKAFGFDINISFTREKWHGRIKAARGIGASLLEPQVKLFEKEHWEFMKKQPEVFNILHSATFCILKKSKKWSE